MAQATISLPDLERALQLVKAAGYRVTKPKSRKLTSRGPTCVVRFADGALCRMATHCRDDALDWDRLQGSVEFAAQSANGTSSSDHLRSPRA